MFIHDSAGLAKLYQALEHSELVTLDTEFAAERRYFPRFDLLQIGTRELCAAVDVHADLSLAPLFERICDPQRTLILHAGSQDLAILFRRFGRIPSRIFDTQLAAAFAGHGAFAGFGSLVQEVLGVELPKSESLTDWSRRPLKEQQLEYALDDVRYLIPLYEHFMQRLAQLGRLEWFQEESRRQLEAQRYLTPEPRDRWRRIGGWSNLTPSQLAVLQEVCAWRESFAQRQDVPARVILPDDVLTHLARRAPSSLKELREIRQVFERTVQECGRDILDAVRIGKERSDLEDLEARIALHRVPTAVPGLVELLQAQLEAEAARHGIAVGLLATPPELAELVAAQARGEAGSQPLLNGWRATLVGDAVQGLLEGRLSLHFDPATNTVVTRG